MNDTTFHGDGKVAYVPVVVDAKSKPMRNADKIRSMSDEELAEKLKELICPFCIDNDYVGKCGPNGGCKKCWLDWLRQEALP